MAAHVRGSKRLKIIQNYLNGKEDDVFEVFPTKTEGKYIVRKRTEPIAKPQVEPIVKPSVEPPIEPQVEPIAKPQVEPPVVEQPIAKPKSTPQPIYDPTINIEILKQLKLLGEEMKSNREKKEQKRMIKEVVNKQMMKQPRYNYTQPQYIQEPNDKSFDLAQAKACEVEQEEPPEMPPPIQQPLRRRNNIFSDIY